MRLRKTGKASWHYDCRACGYTSPRAPDQLRAEEAGLRHERGYEHLGNLLTEAFAPVQEAATIMVDAYMELGRAVVDNIMAAFAPLAEAFAQPQNVPHDPTLRGDKRKWGGK